MVLGIEKATKRYGDQVIFQNFTAQLDFMKHKIYRIKGDSGKGKTTLMRLLSTLEKPDSGEIFIVMGEAAGGGKGLQSSWMFQENRLLENLSAIENLSLIPSTFTASEKIQFFEYFFSAEDKNKKVSEYSGGMKRRLAFLRAMIVNFDILFLDEPFTGIDEENRLKMEQFLLDFIGTRPMIFASHDEPLLWKNYGSVEL